MKVMSPSSDTIYVRTTRVTLLDYWEIWSLFHRSSCAAVVSFPSSVRSNIRDIYVPFPPVRPLSFRPFLPFFEQHLLR